MMAGQYEYIFRYYGVRPVIGGRVEHTVTHEFGTILKEGGSNLHYVRVQFDDYADPSYCHPLELDFLAPDEVEAVAVDRKAASSGSPPDATAPLSDHSRLLQEAEASEQVSSEGGPGFQKSAEISESCHEKSAAIIATGSRD